MNKLLLYLGCIILCICSSACEGLFERELPPHQMVGENAIVDEVSAETALIGVYSYLGNFGDPAAYYIADNAYRLGFLSGAARTPFEEQLLKLSFDPEISYIKEKWKMCAEIVNAANNVIYYVERLPDNKFGEGRKQEIMAEARFMRAFGQIQLLKFFSFFWDIDSEYGPIMRREPSQLSNSKMPRTTVREGYRLILEDLDDAIEHAPAFKSVFRISRGAAKAFKADLLMMRGQEGDFQLAKNLAEEVIRDYEFKDEVAFADVFKNGYHSSELLFSRYLSKEKLSGDLFGGLIVRVFGGNYTPTQTFRDILGEDDKRYDLTLDSVQNDLINKNKKSLAWIKMYRPDANCPMYYMRLAQMHLVKAEVLARLDAPYAEVLAPLNWLRHRAGNDPIPVESIHSRDQLMELVFLEIVRELAMENGSEWFAAIRFKDAAGNRFLKKYNRYYVDDRQLVLPIPAEELKYNENMVENPLMSE